MSDTLFLVARLWIAWAAGNWGMKGGMVKGVGLAGGGREMALTLFFLGTTSHLA